MKCWAYLTFAAFLAFGAAVNARDDANTKTTVGPVKSVSGSFFTVDANNTTMKFKVDANTSVHVKGGSTKARAKKAAGEGGLTIDDVVHVGDQVQVKYTDTGGSFLASDIDVLRPRPQSALPVK